LVGRFVVGGDHADFCFGGRGNSLPVNKGETFRSGEVTIPPMVSMDRAGRTLVGAELVSAAHA
jgi:hypothetical protein